MKFSSAALAAVTAAAASSTAAAFVPSAINPSFVAPARRASDAGPLAAESRPDSSEAVSAAMKASEEFGPQSKEARLAWEAVEEMDASDNSVATLGGIDEDECLVDDPNKICEEYYEKLEELSALIEAQKPTIDKVKTLASEVKNVKIAGKSSGEAGKNSPQMEKALAEARAATEEYGITSPEAKLAWEALEEIASSDLTEATKGSLDEECLVETLEACEAIEELGRALEKEAGSKGPMP